MHETYKVVAVVFALQVMVLISSALVFNAYGGSLVHEISQQDAQKFTNIAESLLADGHFHLPGNPAPDTWLTPLYPLVIALVYAVTGHSLAALVVLLAFVGAMTSGLLYRIGRELSLPRSWAFGAALLFGISPAVMWIPPSGMGGDILFVFLLTLALYLLVTVPDGGERWLKIALIGFILGLATLDRPIGFFLAFIMIAAIPFFKEPRVLTRRALAALGVALVAFYLPLLPWMARNEAVAGHFSLSSQFAFNPFYYNIPGFYAWENGTSVETEQNKLMDAVGTRDTYALVNGFTYSDQLTTIDRHFLTQNLLSYLKFHLYKTLPFFVGSGVNVIYATITNEVPNMPDVPFFPRATQNTSTLFYGGSYSAVLSNLLYYWPATLERLAWLIVFILAFIAPFVTQGRQRRFAILGAMFIIAIAMLASPIAQPRYRIPAEPFIWLGAAFALAGLRSRLKSSGRLFKTHLPGRDDTLADNMA